MALRIGPNIGMTSTSGGGAYSVFTPGINNNGFAPLFAHGDGGMGDAAFVSGADGPALFPRQPVLVKAKNGDILAFAQLHEGSVQATGDQGISAIQMRRSSNNGATFGAPSIVYHETGYSSTVVWINFGVVVVNRVSGRIHLWFTHNLGSGDAASEIDAYYTYSDDHGYTWQTAVDLSGTVKKASGTAAPFDDTDGAWGWWIAGPAPGIQLLNGPYGTVTNGANGRILIPCDHRYTADNTGTSWSHVMYSDDDGATWSLAGLTESTAANDYSNEFTIAEYGTSGHIYGQMRVVNNTDFRGATKSTDGGITWSTMVLNNGVATSIDGATTTTNMGGKSTQGCVVGVPNSNTLYCLALNDTGTRANLTLWRSENGGVTWPTKRVLDRRVSAYSSMLVVDPTSLLLAWENVSHIVQHRTGTTYYPCQYIRAARLPVGWVADKTSYPEYYHWDFNDGSVGSISFVGQQIRDRGPMRNCNAAGLSAGGLPVATFSATGLTTDGTNAAVLLCEENNDGSADASLGNCLDIGAEDWTFEITGFVMASNTTTRTIADNRNGSGAGWTLTVTTGHKPAFSYSDGTNTGGATSSVSVDTGEAFTIRCIRNAATDIATIQVVNSTGTTTSNSGADSSPAGNIVGTQNTVLGARADGTTNPAAFSCYSARVTKGIAKTSGFISNTDTKLTLSQLHGYTVTPPASLPASASTAKLFVGATYDGGWYCGLDHYGGWDKGALPLLSGLGYQSYRDIASGKLFQSQSQNQSLYWSSDSVVGYHHRPSYNAVSANGAWRISSASLGTILDGIQTNGKFTLRFDVKLEADTGGNQTLFSTIQNNTNANGIVVLYSRTNATTGLVYTRIVGTNGSATKVNVYNNTVTGAQNITVGTWYAVTIQGSGYGNALRAWVVPYAGSLVAPTMGAGSTGPGTLVDPAGTTPYASGQPLAIGATSDGSGAAGNVRMKNILVWTTEGTSGSDNDVLSATAVQDWTNFSVAY